MATSYGPVAGNSRIRFEYAVSHDASTTTIYVAAYLDMLNGWTSSGTYPASWSGQWGSGGNNVYRNIPANGSSFVVGDAYYYLPRGSSDYEVSFQAQAQNYTGYPSHTLAVIVPKAVTAPPAPTFNNLDQVTNTSIGAAFTGNGDGGSPITRWELQ